MKSTATAQRGADDERLDLVFGALSDRTRRAILGRLARAPASVGELAEPFAMSFSAVSKHLQVLERAGLVEREVDGRMRRCSLNAEPLRDAEQWIAYYRAFWDDTLDALAAYVEEGEAPRDRPPSSPARRRSRR
jgi:DNA-binding transcriptional ArsR family regulator